MAPPPSSSVTGTHSPTVAFRAYDKDRSGFIDREEVEELLKANFESDGTTCKAGREGEGGISVPRGGEKTYPVMMSPFVC